MMQGAQYGPAMNVEGGNFKALVSTKEDLQILAQTLEVEIIETPAGWVFKPTKNSILTEQGASLFFMSILDALPKDSRLGEVSVNYVRHRMSDLHMNLYLTLFSDPERYFKELNFYKINFYISQVISFVRAILSQSVHGSYRKFLLGLFTLRENVNVSASDDGRKKKGLFGR